MEMYGLSLVVFLLFNIVGRAVNINIATGANYTFRSNIAATIQSIQWTRDNNLVVECDPPGDPFWYQFETQAELNPRTGDLTLKAVKKEDKGVFKGQFQVNGVLQYAEYSVTVMDPVPKPTVTCVRYNKTQVTLECKVEPPAQGFFKWTGPNGFTQVGYSVQISSTETSSIYYCIVSNEVSTNEAEFSLMKCPSGPNPSDKNGTNIAAILVPIVLIGGFIVAALLVWKTRVYRKAPCLRHKSGKSEGTKTDQTNGHNTDEDSPLGKDDHL